MVEDWNLSWNSKINRQRWLLGEVVTDDYYVIEIEIRIFANNEILVIYCEST